MQALPPLSAPPKSPAILFEILFCIGSDPTHRLTAVVFSVAEVDHLGVAKSVDEAAEFRKSNVKRLLR